MDVYNVGRQWFSLKNDANTVRREAGLKPDAIAKITINNREELALLLNALCGPVPTAPEAPAPETEAIVPAAVVERAFVDPDLDIPLFLLRERDQMAAMSRRVRIQRGEIADTE